MRLSIYTILVLIKQLLKDRLRELKRTKTRLTIAVTCNGTDSDCVELMILGHATKSRCFDRKSETEHGFFYSSNKKT